MGTLEPILLLILGAAVIAFIVYLCYLPGKIAKQRNHPQAEAITVCGWVGLIFWPCIVVAFIWAHTNPPAKP